MSNKAQAWRRWFGLVFLAIAFAMLVWGQTVLKPRLDGLAYILYWLGCFVFTVLAMMTALLDIWFIRRKQRQDRKDLVRKTFANVDEFRDEAGDDETAGNGK